MNIEARYQRLLDRFCDGILGRRHFLANVGLMAAACGVAGSAVRQMIAPARAAGTLRFDGYGGYSQAAFDKLVLKPFAQETGTTVTQGSYANPDQMLAQIQAEGVEHYNVFWAAQELSPIKIMRRGWGEYLDASKMPRLRDLLPSAVEANRTQGGGKLISVPYSLSGGAIAYNTKLVTPEEMEQKGFGILVDPKYKGSIAGIDNWQYRIYYAALQLGQNPNDIADMAAVWDKVRESKRSVLKFYTSSAEQISLLTSGNIAVADAWFVPIANMRKRGDPIGFWPVQGAYVQSGSLVALKGTPMDLFYHMVDVLLRPEVMFPLAIETGNLPLLDPAKYPFPKEVSSIPGYLPSGSTAKYLRFDPIYWDKNSDAWQREYQRVITRA